MTSKLQVTSPFRVLVVDDDPDFSEAVGDLASFFGSEVRVVHSGEAALSALGEFHPDLILLDLGMQDMDGYETARRIREHPAGPGVKLIALTGWGRTEDISRTRKAGFDFHLVKPNGLAVLKTILTTRQLPT